MSGTRISFEKAVLPPVLAGGSTKTEWRSLGPYSSPESRDRFLAMYDARLARWPVPFEELDVPTRLGRTHVVAAGDPDAPPVILLHMFACTAFSWSPVIAPLTAHHRTYAVDIIGDIGKSELADPKHYAKTGADFSGWLCDVADALHVGEAHIVGGSYGGWVAMHHAAHAPERVRRLVLLVPMGLPSWMQTAYVLLRLATMQLGRSGSRIGRTLSWMMGDDPAARREFGDWMRAVVTSRWSPRVGKPFPLPAETRRAIRAPTLLVLGGKDNLIGDVATAVRRAVSTIPDVTVEVLANGTHALSAEEPQRVGTLIAEFLEEADSG